MKATRYPLWVSVVTLASLAAFTPGQENVWTSHGPGDIGWVADVAIAGSTAWAVTLNGVFRSDDGGATWRASGLVGKPINQIVARSGAPAIFAKASSDGLYPPGPLYVSRDAGQSWAASSLPDVFAVALDPTQSSTAYATTLGRFWKSTDAGATWESPSSLPADYGFALAVDSAAIYVLTNYGPLYKSSDGGASWTAASPPLENTYAIASAPGGTLDAVGVAVGGSSFCRSGDGAETWSCSPFPAYADYNTRIAPLPGGGNAPPRILVESGAGLLLSPDGGATWRKTAEDLAALSLDNDPHGVASDESGSLVLAGSQRSVLRSLDRGETWTSSASGLQAAWIDVVASDPHDASKIWAGGVGGIYRSSDAGLSWSAVHETGYAHALSIAIDPTDPSTVYVGSDELYRTRDGGETWPGSSLAGDGNPVYSLALDPRDPQRVWAGLGGGLASSEDGGTTWKPAPIAQIVFSILVDRKRPDTMYAGSYFHESQGSDYDYPYGGSVFVSHDRGKTFTQGPQLFSEVIAIAQDPFFEGAIYIATTWGGVFRSADGGLTWKLRSTGLAQPLGAALIADPVRPGRFYAGTRKGVYRTTDGGGSWEPFSSGLSLNVSSLAISADGKTLHAGTWGGGVFELDLRTDAPSFPCTPSALRLCLLGNRYAVDLLAGRPGETVSNPGVARTVNDRSGFFSLPFATGDAELPEVVVKMLPDEAFGVAGAPIFYSSLTTLPYILTLTDTVTGEQKSYVSDPATPLCGGADIAFNASTSSLSVHSDRTDAQESALSLLGGRFSITLEANRPGSSQTAKGLAIASGDRFGFFSLPALTGDPSFPEVVVKMIDARLLGGKFWFFQTSLTSLEYTLTVTDSLTGAVRVYQSAGGFCGSADTSAFVDSPPAAGAIDLNGAWAGQVTFPSDCYSTCSPSESVRMSLSQVGRAVSGRFSTSCLGEVALRGTLDGDRLTVDLDRGFDPFEGSASSKSVSVSANCDPWGYGDHHTMVITLSRTGGESD